MERSTRTRHKTLQTGPCVTDRIVGRLTFLEHANSPAQANRKEPPNIRLEKDLRPARFARWSRPLSLIRSASEHLVHGQRHRRDSAGGKASCDPEKSSQINKRSSKFSGDWRAKSGRSSILSTRARRAAIFRTQRPFGRLCDDVSDRRSGGRLDLQKRSEHGA